MPPWPTTAAQLAQQLLSDAPMVCRGSRTLSGRIRVGRAGGAARVLCMRCNAVMAAGLGKLTACMRPEVQDSGAPTGMYATHRLLVNLRRDVQHLMRTSTCILACVRFPPTRHAPAAGNT